MNWSLTTRLAAEFQGFSRDLHDEAADAFCASVSGGNATLGQILRNGLSAGRQLDRGNAQPGSLGNDFFRLGLIFWPAIEAADRRAARWKADLGTLNVARNAIAHDDENGFLKLQALSKYPITLKVVKGWHRSLDGLARTMDDVVGGHVGGVCGRRPW